MAIALRTSSTTAGGTANATSLGGRPSASAPSTASAGYWSNITSAQNDSGRTDYRCLFLYNSGVSTINNVIVTASNKGGGSTVTVAASSVATNTFASYTTAVIATDTTAPAITGSYAGSVNIGTLTPGQVKAVWFRRITAAKTAASTGDTCAIVISGQEVVS